MTVWETDMGMAPAISEIKKQIDNYFSDRTRTQAETREGLEDLQAEIEVLLTSLPEKDDD
jgi:flagellar basal body-associated protein FliL